MFDLSRLTPVYTIHEKQRLCTTIEEAWKFLSDPSNLAKITPPEMGFEIVSGADRPMYAGQLIAYNVSPMLGIRIRWVSEITSVQEGEYFIDEQQVGPYRLWHHEHRLTKLGDEVEMEDVIHYILPLGPLGALLHRFVVAGQLAGIFDYRRKQLKEIFPARAAAASTSHPSLSQ